MSTPLQTVENFMQLTNHEHDIDRAAQLMAEDIKFTGPGMQCNNKLEYKELLSQFLSSHAGWKKHQAFERGNEVCFIEDIYINAPNGSRVTLELAEWFKISGGKIQEHKIFYDPTEFRSAFGMA